LKKRIIAAVAVFGLLGGILYFAYAQTAAQNNVKHFTAFLLWREKPLTRIMI